MKLIYCPDVEGLDSIALGREGAAKMTVKPLSNETVCLRSPREVLLLIIDARIRNDAFLCPVVASRSF